MAQDTSTSSALQQLAFLNRQIGESFAPINNFTSQNVQLAVAEQRARQEQANHLESVRLQSQLEQDRMRQQEEAAMNLARFTHKAAGDQALDVAKFHAAHEDAVRIKIQADQIRGDQVARRVVGNEIANQPDTPEGNAKLVSAYTKALSDPNVMEKMNLDQAVGITKEIKTVLGQLSAGFDANTPQSKRAIQQFLAMPGVADVLIKKGKMSIGEIEAIRQGADPSKVKNVIDRVAHEASWVYGTDKNVLSQLTGAWNQALVDTGAATSPDQLVQADYLKTLLARRDDYTKGLTSPDSWKALTAAHGMGPGGAPKLPPPAVDAGLANPAQSNFGPTNPFNPPAAQPSDKVGLAALLTPTAKAVSDGGAGLRYTSYADSYKPDASIPVVDRARAQAFHPAPLAKDPYTELEVRKRILQNTMENEQFKSGLSQSAPLIPNYQPQYDPYKQTQDEQTLEQLVRGLYGIGR